MKFERVEDLKEYLAQPCFTDTVVLESPAYVSAVVGISTDGRLIYSRDLMVKHLREQGGDLQKGRSVNCLCNNKWERRLLVGKLNALSQMHGYELVPINPAYSSIVGNFVYGNMHTPDMVAASIEIARRAYKKFEKGWFYPKFNAERLDERWKQTLAGVKTWKELAQKVKEAGLKYRFLLADCIRNAVFSKSYNRQKWERYIFAT